VSLPFKPPVEPMLAKLATAIPDGEGWLYEPKWDGFRALVFRDGDDVYIQSRELKPLDRYFPELAEPLKACLPKRAVVDGEIVIAGRDGLDFEALLQRIHPAASRVARLAAETPSSFVIWDLLAEGDEDLRGRPLAERRKRLERVVRADRANGSVHLTPVTTDRATALDWFERFEGAGLDGVVAKRLDGGYQPGQRAMVKVKHQRTADCVVGGFRWHKDGLGTLVGSLLLGLYDAEGVLHHVGIAASFTRARRAELVRELEPYRKDALDEHPWRDWRVDSATQRQPGASSRWNRAKDLSWQPVRPELVCEVAFDHLQGTRFRHATHFLRWRPDKSPRECRYDQLAETPAYELGKIFTGPAAGRSRDRAAPRAGARKRARRGG
jgi:ATP-dependent DNA ligase